MYCLVLLFSLITATSEEIQSAISSMDAAHQDCDLEMQRVDNAISAYWQLPGAMPGSGSCGSICYGWHKGLCLCRSNADSVTTWQQNIIPRDTNNAWGAYNLAQSNECMADMYFCNCQPDLALYWYNQAAYQYGQAKSKFATVKDDWNYCGSCLNAIESCHRGGACRGD